MLQISINKLNKKNEIISYSANDYPLLKKMIIFSLIFNFFIIILYLFELSSPNTFIYLSAPETRYQQNSILLFIFFLFYMMNMIRIIKLVFEKKINKDIYTFVLKDKISYILGVSYLVFLLLHLIKNYV